MKASFLPASRRAFTLVEILVVLAIISMIMFFTVPNMGEIIQGSKLTQAGDQLKFDLGLAQQTAVKDNVTVEVRFYQYKQPDEAEGSESKIYSAYHMFSLIPDSDRPSDPTAERILAPIGKIKKLPVGVVIPDSEVWSTLVNKATIANGTEEVFGLVPTEKRTVATYRSFQINPDGSTNLDSSGADQWYVTLVDSNEIVRSGGSIDNIAPNNYICLQVDAFNGGTRWFQPN
ncbi:MAG: Verru_Chthon cassette protein D [Verrucomicrobiota bacterium]